MINSVLVVCVGNICRSPLGERMLASVCPNLRVESAGIAALVDHEADETVAHLAEENGVTLDGHRARQFSAELAQDFDLVLAMEKGHLRVIGEQAPAASGKSMLFGQWIAPQDIPDPYQKSEEFHAATLEKISQATAAWAGKLG